MNRLILPQTNKKIGSSGFVGIALLTVAAVSLIAGVSAWELNRVTKQENQTKKLIAQNMNAEQIPANSFTKAEPTVLADTATNFTRYFEVNVASVFHGDVQTNKTNIGGALTLGGDVTGKGVNVDLGNGKITAGNVVYSLQGKSGAVSLEAGDGITINGLKISATDSLAKENLFKKYKTDSGTVEAKSVSDTLSVVGGDGVEVSANAGSRTLTVSVTEIPLGENTSGDYVKNISAGTGVQVSTTSGEASTPTVSLYHLGLQTLTAPTSDKIYYYDNSTGTSKWLTVGTGLSIVANTLNADSTSGGDISTVGDCTTGSCFTGTSGTSLTFFDADGTGTLATGDLTAARTWTLPNASGTVLTTGNLTDIIATGTVASGVWQGSVVDVAHGGTGNSSLTAYSLLTGGTTSTSATQQVSGLGTGGQVLTSNGAGALPTWQNASGSISGSGITNQVAYWTDTSTLAGESNLSVTRGGTGAGTLTGLVLGNGASAFTTITNNSANWDAGYTYRITSASGTSPLTLTLASNGLTGSISDASADGSTKGISTFTASDFNTTSGLVSIDYANGQASNGSTKGFLTSANWTTFNDKESAISAGTSGEYYRGDKTWQTLNQSAVAGLTTSDSPTFAGATLNGLLGIKNGTYKTTFANSGTQTIDIAYVLPTAAGGAGEVLKTDVSGNLYWATIAGGSGGIGTVTSVGSGNGLTGGPVTTSGTLAISLLNAETASTATTSSFSGLEFVGASNQLSLLHGCAASEILSWNDTAKTWQCASVSGIGGVTGSGVAGQVAYWSSGSGLTGNAGLTFSGGVLALASASAPTADMLGITNSGYGTVTNGVDGLSIDFTSTADAGADTNSGINIAFTPSGEAGDTGRGINIATSGVSAGTLYGINIAGITGGAGTETALVIGSGWDTSIDASGTIIGNAFSVISGSYHTIIQGGAPSGDVTLTLPTTTGNLALSSDLSDYTPLAHKTTEDAINGLVFVNGAGTYSAKVIGTDVQAYDAELAGLAGLTYVSGTPFIKMTAAGTFALDTNTYLTSVTAHNLLSTAHGDTTASTVARGDLIVGTGASATWDNLALGTVGKILRSDGTDLIYSTATYPTTATTTGAYLRADGTDWITSTLVLPNAGTAYRLPVFSATNTMTELAAVGATGEYLAGSTGAIPAWATLNQAAVAGLTTASSPTFTGLTATGASGITLGTSATTMIPGYIKLFSAGTSASNNYYTTFTAGTQTGNATYTLPTSSTTGLLKNTTGTLSWDASAYMTNPMDAIGQLIYGGASGVATKLTAGTSGQLLRSGGAGAPTWSTATFPSTATTAGAYLRADGTNWITSTLVLPNAGTAYKLAAYTATNTLTELAAVGATGQMLQGVTGGIPVWSTTTYPTTNAINTLLYASSANTMAALATANSGVLVTGATGIPSIATDLPTAVTIGGGYVYRVGGTDVSLADGGTGASLTAVNGGIAYSTASAMALSAAGSTGQMLQSGGAGAPTWSTATFPSTATTAGSILRADGTNWVGSTATYPNTITANQLLYATASNTLGGSASLTFDGDTLELISDSASPQLKLTYSSGIFAGLTVSPLGNLEIAPMYNGTPAAVILATGTGVPNMLSDEGSMILGGSDTDPAVHEKIKLDFESLVGSNAVGISSTTGVTSLVFSAGDLTHGVSGRNITIGNNTHSDSTAAGTLDLVSKGGTNGYLWQDAAGKIRIYTAAPLSDSDDTHASSVVVGDQTSTRDTKQNIVPYTDYNGALQIVSSAPLNWFKYKNEVQGYGENDPLTKTRLGFIADEVSPLFMWGNSIDQVSVNGLLIGSVKALKTETDNLNGLFVTGTNATSLINTGRVAGARTSTDPALVAANVNLNVLGTIMVKGGVEFNGVAEFNNKSAFNALVSFAKAVSFGAKVTFLDDVEFGKNMNIIGDVAFLGRPTFNKDTAGRAVIKKGMRQVDVVFEKEYADVPVVNASLAVAEKDSADILGAGYNFVVAEQTTKGFSIVINKKAVTPVSFSWVALAIKDATTTTSPDAPADNAEAPVVPPPADTTTVPPADTTTVPPVDTTTVPPADTTTVPPADTTTVPPADTTTVPPADQPPTDPGTGGAVTP